MNQENIENNESRRRDVAIKKSRPAWLTLALMGCTGFAIGLIAHSWPGDTAPNRLDGALSSLLPTVMAQTTDDLGDGNYSFLANRRTIWAINKAKGRFAGYHFREDEDHTVERTRIITLDPKIFPPADTIYMLSDRNLTEVVWVCNKRTGDIQLWTPRIGGDVKAEKPLSTAQDLKASK